jgi:hypothetical protein
MTITGGALELFGFALVVFQLARVQRQEFGWPRFVVRSWGWVRATARRLLRRPRIVHAVSVDMAGTSDIAGRLSVRKGMGPQAADRFAAIEFNLEQIESELTERIREVHASVAKLRDELTTTRSVIDQQEREREEERKAELRSSLAWEAWGVVFFLCGTVLSVLGSV